MNKIGSGRTAARLIENIPEEEKEKLVKIIENKMR